MSKNPVLSRLGSSKSLPKRILFRILFVLPFAAALGLFWWSLSRLRPVVKETAAATARVSRISFQIEEMEEVQQRMLTDRVSERYRETLLTYIDSESALADWLADVRDKAVPLALVVRTELGEPELRILGGTSLNMIPVRIEIQPNTEVTATRSAYQRLLEFCQFIALHSRRADASDLSVSGSAGNVSHAVLNLQLWARPPAS